MANQDSFRDGYLTQGGVKSLSSTTVSLTADNQNIDVNALQTSYINLVSDNTTAANRTFTLSLGQNDGQLLILVLTSGSSTTCQLANSGNAVLNMGAWEPTQYDSLTLRYNSRQAKWVEEGRNGLVKLANLASGVTPSHVVKFAGSFTTAGGDANESITVTGALSSDIAVVVLHTVGATPRTILTAQAATDAVNVVFSGDPSTDHIVRYVVFRAAA